jgi:1-acyl-sn-glycerol-3-phosphate acyltransferase
MNNSISPQKTPFSQKFFSKLLTHLGWSFEKNIPDLPKFLVVGAPHTSNWDFIYFLLFIKAVGIKVSFIGKDTAFWWPMGILLKKIGGIPVNRRVRGNFVEQIIEKFNQNSNLIILITPEGTRHKTNYWKSGFYYIAVGAQIPILLGYIDYPSKKLGLGPIFIPSGDIHEDFKIIQNFYADKTGKFPHEQGAIQLSPTNPQSS